MEKVHTMVTAHVTGDDVSAFVAKKERELQEAIAAGEVVMLALALIIQPSPFH